MSTLVLVLVSIFFSSVFSGLAQKQDLNRVTTNDKCNVSITTCSNFMCPKKFCSGELIFEENFNNLEKKIWKPEVTLLGGGAGEFQMYVGDDENSFSKDGKLYIKPSLTVDKIGQDELENGHFILQNCTSLVKEYCERQAGGNIIINPIRSARLITRNSFSFKYGRIEVIAKMPEGDWLWPAVWLLPTKNKFGKWPMSGEIDLLESRGNLNYKPSNIEIGVQQVASTLHFGPDKTHDGYRTAHYPKNDVNGFHSGFHSYEFIWSEKGAQFFIDKIQIGFAKVGDGFWKRGKFEGKNIWAEGTKMAPFDQEFYFVLNVAVGGTSGYFPDISKKPWRNGSKASAMKDFWTNRDQWLDSWNFESDNITLIVDSVKVWAI